MTIRRSLQVLLPLLALSLSLAPAVTVHAQGGQYNSGSSVSGTLRINLGGSPRWAMINGTHVEEIAEGQRPNYDVFRYNGGYYAYNNNHWYSSPNDRGDFVMIDDSTVPNELNAVPREHWRNYPTQWAQRNPSPQYQAPGRSSVSLTVRFGNTPRWSNVRGTRVDEISDGQRPDYDMFRYNGGYYAYNNNRWYSSQSEQGQFTMIDDADVPRELNGVPRDHWRNYPQGWDNASAPVDYSRQNRAPVTIQINFRNRVQWVSIQGTQVMEIRGYGRPDYDMFRYGGSYYVYNYDHWYMSNYPRGNFRVIDGRLVPWQLSRVPRDHWRNYPTAWMDQQRNPRNANRHRGNGRYSGGYNH